MVLIEGKDRDEPAGTRATSNESGSGGIRQSDEGAGRGTARHSLRCDGRLILAPAPSL